jgi:hypothetical protein
MNNLYASDELIKKYEEIGFAEKSERSYMGEDKKYHFVYHLSDLQQWMFDTHGLWCGAIVDFVNTDVKLVFCYEVIEVQSHGIFSDESFNTHTECLSAGLLKAYEIIKERQK